MNKTGELVISHFTAVAVAALVLPAAIAAGQASSSIYSAMLGNDDAANGQATLKYLMVTAVIGAVLAVTALLRFPESGRRVCAAWGMTAAIVLLTLFLGLLAWLSVAFQRDSGWTSTPRQLLARTARDWLPFITLFTYIAALSWGLFARWKPATGRRRALQLTGASVLTAVPSVTVALWFVWHA